MSEQEMIARKLRQVYDVLHCIYDQHEDEGDRCYFGSTNDPHTMKRQLRRMEAILTTLEASRTPEGMEVLRLVTMHDDGEHDPHEAEQCGIFTSPELVRKYVETRFADSAFEAVPHGSPDDPAWHLIERATGEDSNLVLITWRETLNPMLSASQTPIGAE